MMSFELFSGLLFVLFLKKQKTKMLPQISSRRNSTNADDP